MAKVKFGMYMTDARGKQGGHVFTKNRSGACVRTKVSPTNPQTASQVAARARFSVNSQGWRGLTDDQRQAWNSAVGDFKGTNIFGDIVTPSGINLYVRINTQLALIGEAAISTPPLPTEVARIITLSVASASGAGTMVATYADAIPADTHAVILATPAMSPGRSFVKSDLRVIGSFVAADVSPLDIATEYETKFGSIGAAGQKIHFQMYLIDDNTGLVGAIIAATSVIGA
jgi:hypothetical protein